MNSEYTLKVINLLRREANSITGIAYDLRLGHSGLTIDQLEALEDQLEAEIIRSMADSDSVSEKGDSLAHDIKEQYFSAMTI